ncbi:carbon-nitrogen family hydrolase [Nitriliruptoraceae bacterium ZYF776]|nr:carbon-nitrogen family hydrolase [Profundirhabdus halotolerans]
MRVALVQHAPVWEDRDATLAELDPVLAGAAASGGRLLVLPELFATGFSMATDRIAEPVDGPTVAWLRERAAEHDVWLAGSLAERRDGDTRPRNVCVLVAPDGTVHRYAKQHPFTYAGEGEAYLAGDHDLTVDVDGVRVTPTVCFDLRFPEQYRATVDDTDAYLVVASWPARRAAHWRALLRARAIENQAYVVGVNRVGRDGNDVDHAGDSVVHDPNGDVLVQAGAVETVLVVDLDAEVVATARERLPFLRDRRPRA